MASSLPQSHIQLLSIIFYLLSIIHTKSQMNITDDDIDMLLFTTTDDEGGGGNSAGDIANDIGECLNLGADIIDERHNDTCFATMIVT
eukprot:CAMPEP_0201565268 /NCGR_PEP_ID=MMETSP0190_2-20130828/4256_1 /ASSEMBLY_ACC=CAM_ASM_000263 /TAXON_ID=37353 /ORGANISM="Rosalina sp." /LENGTH=87 /DNA_ID=CAMNT_0047982559 /DNA_START=23 /DNA_END=283 /DNA_ORIENTATION=-